MVFGQKLFKISCTSSCDYEHSGLPQLGDDSDFIRPVSAAKLIVNDTEDDDTEDDYTEDDYTEDDETEFRDGLVSNPTREISSDRSTDVFGARGCPGSLPDETDADVPVASELTLMQGNTEMQQTVGLGEKKIYDSTGATYEYTMLMDKTKVVTSDPIDLDGFGILNSVQDMESSDDATCGRKIVLDGAAVVTSGLIDLGNFGIAH